MTAHRTPGATARVRGPGSRHRLTVGLVAAVVAAAGAALIVAGCSTTETPSLVPPVSTTRPAMTVTPAVNQTRAELVRVLGDHDLVLVDSQAPVRPAEGPLLTAAPRAVYQVQLPADPSKGFIVVYEFPDATRAAAAATEQQAYRATGPGRVQTPEGTVTIIRQVGSTVVLYDWLPGAAQDPSAVGIQAALESLGVGYPIPG